MIKLFRLIFFLVLLLVLSTAVFSETTTYQVTRFIKNHNILNSSRYLTLRNLSADLNDLQRQKIYVDTKKNPGIGMINLILPGLGSFIMGDVAGGFILLGGWAASSTLITLGTIAYMESLSYGESSLSGLNSKLRAVYLLGIGIPLAIATFVGDIALPFIYSDKYNVKLSLGLRLD